MWGSRYLQVFNRGSKSNDNPSSAIVNQVVQDGWKNSPGWSKRELARESSVTRRHALQVKSRL
jgi:hypothetical protein